MDFKQFTDSLGSDEPDHSWGAPLKALWFDKNGFWEKAHDLIQHDQEGPGAWVHAYLHRKEGDIWNADYWYRRADKVRPHVSLSEEWEHLVKALLFDPTK